MFGNGKVFISHSHEDTALCDLLAAALDAWQVDYWLDRNQLSAGQELFAYITQALGERDIFIRVCTPAAHSSAWMAQEAALARDLRAPNRRGRRLIINLLMAPGYHLSEIEQHDVVIDATRGELGPWVDRLRKTLGIPERGRHPNRRAFIGLGVTGVAALGALGAVGDLLLAPPATPGYRPTTHAFTPTPQASASRLVWSYTVGTDLAALNSMGVSVGASGLYVAGPAVLVSLGLTDGVLRWENSSNILFSQSGPAIVGNMLYALAQQGNALVLLAADAQTGALRWRLTLDPNSNGSTSFNAAHIVAAGADVIIQYNSTTALIDTVAKTFRWLPIQQHYDELAALDVLDTDLWAAPAISGGVIYAGVPDGNLYAYSLSSGSQLWAYTQFAPPAPLALPPAIQSTPVVADGVVYFGRNDGTCYAVNATSGALVWQRQLGDSSYVSSVTLANGVIYLCTGSSALTTFQQTALQADAVFALDAQTGRILWQTHPSQAVAHGQLPAFAMMNQPLFLNGTLYITASLAPTPTTKRDVLYALDSADGSAQWQLEVVGQTISYDDNNFPSAPIAYNDMLYFVSSAATVYALSIQ